MEIIIQSIQCVLQLIGVWMMIDSVTVLYTCTVVLFLALYNLGLLYKEKGMINETIKTLEECLAIERSFLPMNNPDIGTSLFCLVNLFPICYILFVHLQHCGILAVHTRKGMML